MHNRRGEETPAPDGEPTALQCPNCRLTITQRHRSLDVEFCPRCIAHSRLPVRMLAGESRAASLTLRNYD